MSFLATQFSDYPRVHTERANLLIHLVAVPVFDLSWVAFVAAVAGRSPLGALASVAVAAAAFAAEGRGHALELITFPRFAIGGGWERAYRAASGKRA